MRMNSRIKTVSTLLAMAMAAQGITLSAAAREIPAQLPVPDGKAGDTTKPVKVYILAGQSNMVGMGNVSGARCRYAGIYLTADPAAPKDPMSVARALYKIASHGVYLSADPKAGNGATVSIYEGTYDPATDYDKAKPAKTQTVSLGVVQEALLREASGEKPARVSPFLRDTLYALTEFYQAAGVHDYDWHAFGPDLKNMKWEYHSFDPPETKPREQGGWRFRKVTYPEGMTNWFAVDFDAAKAGWKSGLPPFGQYGGKLEKPAGGCSASFCGCASPLRSLWDKEVLLVRGTFGIPPFKEGHRYRIVIGGSAHVNAGEGYAIYINGKRLVEIGSGVGKGQGGQPRGAFIDRDFIKEFQGGKVTIAATSFLKYHHPRNGSIPPQGFLNLWLDEMKIPPLGRAEGSRRD